MNVDMVIGINEEVEGKVIVMAPLGYELRDYYNEKGKRRFRTLKACTDMDVRVVTASNMKECFASFERVFPEAEYISEDCIKPRTC